MVRMMSLRRIAFGALAAGAFFALAGCPSPFLSAIKQAVANAPFTFSNYSFVRQWGNPNPTFTYTSPIVKVDSAGFAYVTDSSFRIVKYSGSGAVQNTINVVSGSFNSGINDMGFDTAGNMYVTTTSSQVTKYNVSGAVVLTFGSNGTGNGQFTNAEGIGVDTSGNIYVVDYSFTAPRVEVFDSTGAYVTQWGSAGTGPLQFSSPHGLAIDASNTIYVADTGNNRIMTFTTAGVAVNQCLRARAQGELPSVLRIPSLWILPEISMSATRETLRYRS
jgi:sugar lactone lactonase YvrE